MKKLAFLLIPIFIAILLSSCGEPEVYDFYYKCFYLGETGFIIEGEVLTLRQRPDYYVGIVNRPVYSKPPLTEEKPFDFLVARISKKSDSSDDYYAEWEISAIKLSESKFQLQVDITANGITIEKEKRSENLFYPWEPGFPSFPKYTYSSGEIGKFPLFELRFYINEFVFDRNPKFFAAVNNNEYSCFSYRYIYVTESVDLSGTWRRHADNSFFFKEADKWMHYYDCNFTKPGWYKIVEGYYKEMGDEPEYYTGENTNILIWEY